VSALSISRKRIALGGAVLLLPLLGSAVQLASPFADGAVLQRERPVAVWGSARSGEQVTVRFAGQAKTAVTAANGAWRVNLDPMPASFEPRTLSVTADASGETASVTNVLVGEVWFVSGQSNAVCPFWHTTAPRFRTINKGGLIAQYLRKTTIRFTDRPGRWKTMTRENLVKTTPLQGGPCDGSFSALGTFFAIKLENVLGVPVGMIGEYINGSAIQPWIPPYGGHWRAYVARWTPYTIRGVIWNQGCSNVWDGSVYDTMLAGLYAGWSKGFENPELPFIFQETAQYNDQCFDIMLAQQRFAAAQPNAFLSADGDIERFGDAHGNDKEPMARRMLVHALRRVYGFTDIEDEPPTFRSWRVEGDKAILSFDHAKNFYVYNHGMTDYRAPFELAGADGVWKPAELVFEPLNGWASNGCIDSSNLVIRAKGVPSPTRVRYLHRGVANVFNEVCLPLLAFEAGEPSVAEIELVLAASAKEIEKGQAALKDRVSLEAYRPLVASVNGTNVWTAALQKALDEHQVVVIPASNLPYYLDATVKIPSLRRLEAAGATVALLPGTDVVMLRNANAFDGTLDPIWTAKRDHDIAIVGGRFEDWRRSRAGYGMSGRYNNAPRKVGNYYGVSTLFFFNDLDRLSLRDVTFAHTSGFACQCGDAKDLSFVNTVFDSCYADGYHLNGNLHRVHVKNAKGYVGDDLVALNAYDWLDSSVDYGPQRTILCEDLEAPSDCRYPAIRILPATFRYRNGMEVDCSIRDVVFRRVKGVKCFKMYLQTPRYPLGTEPEWSKVGSGGNIRFEDIDIDLDRPIDLLGGYKDSDPVRGHFGAFEFGANLTSVHFKNLRVKFHLDQYPLSHLAVVGPKSLRYQTDDGKPGEIFDPYVNCKVGTVTVEGLKTEGTRPAELVRATVFDDINKDGRSSGRGEIGNLVIKE